MQVAIDLEWYDQTGGDHVTEVGLAIADSKGTRYLHLVIRENSHLENFYAYTSSSGFVFGTSQLVSLCQAKAEIVFWLLGGKQKKNVSLIWHSPHRDDAVLRKLGINILDYVPKENLFDTGEMFKSCFGGGNPKLSHVLDRLKIKYDPRALHNAGNDAAYTLKAYTALE
ncbi:hypothetical protein HK100_001162 [Physocladia obscura]|uniref:Gfd2/YDR514C-like C-terminal domain-containing protein n=1 Tax=Physocladia obscura TaxID=109957 RepID=A0AAD5XB88_9FUNG|nr:hypothetical protein HK100_001162 [Physocladia obscura]